MKRKPVIISIAAAVSLALVGSAAVLGMAIAAKKEEPFAIYEAEDGLLKGTIVSQGAEGFTGTGFVTDFTDEEDQLTIQMEAPKTALYNLRVRYRAPNGNKVAGLSLNGNPHGDLALGPNDRFTDVTTLDELPDLFGIKKEANIEK